MLCSFLYLYFLLCTHYVYAAVLAPYDIKTVKFLNFTGVDKHITLNGEAKIVPDIFSNRDEEELILRLTSRKANTQGLIAGSAFLKIPFAYNANDNYSFSTFFRFRITGFYPYDGSGIVFLLHADPRGDKALAKSQNGLGYSGYAQTNFKSITPSVGIKINVQADGANDIDFNNVGTVLNGDIEPLYPPYGESVADGAFNNGEPWNVWVDYDGNFLTIRTGQDPVFEFSILHTKREMNFKKTFDDSDLYIGFTADPGLSPAYHDILEWHFRPEYKPFGDYCGDNPEDRPETCE